MNTAAEMLIDLARSRGLIRPRDLAPLHIPRVSLTRAVRHGQLERISRGLYGLPGRKVSAHGTLAEVAIHAPIEVRAEGMCCYLDSSHTEVARRHNRRVEVRLVHLVTRRDVVSNSKGVQ